MTALSEAISNRFTVDLRALAAFRIGLGTLLLVDLALRSRSLGAFYTDAGVLPRDALFSDYAGVYSVHALSGEAWAISALFVIAGAFALALLVGYRTRIVTICSWLLLLSLHARNPMVINAGDSLLLMLLFWGIFLPLGAQWSVDAARTREARGDRGSTVSSVATMALLLQVVMMYTTNAIHKTRSDLWMEREAVVYIMQADQFTVHLGNYLAEVHGLLRVMTLLWLGLLVAAPLLLVLTGVPRALLASLYVGMHVGMAATMRLGIFPIVVMVAFLPFYQSIVWDTVSRLASRTGLADTLDRWGEHLQRTGPDLPSIAPSGLTLQVPDREALEDRSARGRALFSTVVPWFFLVLVVLSNAQAVDYTEVPDPAEDVLDTTELDQSWRMFAPNPIRTTNWYAVSGELEDGTTVDVMHDRSVTLDRPANVDGTYPTSRWRKYLANVYQADNEKHRSYLANHLCGAWNRSHETGVETVTIYRVYERTDPYGGTEANGEVTLIEYDCSGTFVQRE